jgi:glycerophosphoryl diester phosphodiesterase
MPALLAAVDSMADIVEFVVRRTKDGQLVIMHDASLARTTNKSGYVWEYTYDELLEADAGGWFSVDYAGTQIPLFSEVLEALKDTVALNVEIKTSIFSPTLTDEIIEMIEAYGMEEQCIITSTDIGALRRVKQLNPGITTGLIMQFSVGRLVAQEEIDVYSIRLDFVSLKLVQQAHEQGKAVYAWTVNKPNDLYRMEQLGVDSVITDNPLYAREVLYSEYSPLWIMRTVVRLWEQRPNLLR